MDDALQPRNRGLSVAIARGAAVPAAVPVRRGIGGLGYVLVAPLSLWLLAAFALPLAVVILLSVQEIGDLFQPLSFLPTGAQFGLLLGDAYYIRVFADTLLLAVGVTLTCAAFAYPVALWLSRLPPRWRALGVALVLVPLLTNVVVRSLGIMLILAPGGIVNSVAKLFGLGELKLLFSWFAVGLALVQVFLPYAIMALYDNLQSIDRRIGEAAASLGAGPVRRFFSVTLPLSLPALRSGLTIVSCCPRPPISARRCSAAAKSGSAAWWSFRKRCRTSITPLPRRWRCACS